MGSTTNAVAIAIAIAIAAWFSLGGCMTSAPEPPMNPTARPMVSRIDLSRTTGEVGEKFEAQVEFESLRLGKAQVEVRSLPPGLHYDAESRTITGVPSADGFFSVTVKVRKARSRGIHFSTPEGAWFTERLSLDIYRPIDDGSERPAWQDKGIAANN